MKHSNKKKRLQNTAQGGNHQRRRNGKKKWNQRRHDTLSHDVSEALFLWFFLLSKAQKIDLFSSIHPPARNIVHP